MKNILPVIMIYILAMQVLFAQNFKDPVVYMEYIGKEHRQTMEGYLAYTSAIAHSKSAKKVDAKRKDLMNTINSAIHRITAMPPFNGDRAYRDSTLAFFKLESRILNEDFGKIMNLEEVAEQSYDAMEAYWLAQDKASEKVQAANKRLNQIQRAFGAANNINIVETKDELEVKMEVAGQVMKYYRGIYLIFFKGMKQEAYLLDAISKKDVSGTEQNNNSLLAIAEEGLKQLGEVSAYKGDNGLKDIARTYLSFLKDAALHKYPSAMDYVLKDQEMKKAELGFNKIPENKRTKADIDNFNKTISDFNHAVNQYNANNNALNTARNRHINDWNKSVQDFLNKHVPRYSK